MAGYSTFNGRLAQKLSNSRGSTLNGRLAQKFWVNGGNGYTDIGAYPISGYTRRSGYNLRHVLCP
eukprot:CAMPEP_0183473314 /NCGR_PEP_ID=MMETSP0370-20130417/161068_1 /TAXON_ID=268820 /ORGANISM="Peridinium aciculiferum, Strain PAER-2" /LENGTH=64 /DNA_ID=CAMNT_0025665997 /DNA_START=69 /DNA_END=259 /DNA_ORIENTATION=-